MVMKTVDKRIYMNPVSRYNPPVVAIYIQCICYIEE